MTNELKQVFPYKNIEEFFEDNFHMGANNDLFVTQTLLNKNSSEWQIWRDLKDYTKVRTKFKTPLISDYDDSEFYLFELDGELFYLRIHGHSEGETVAIKVSSMQDEYDIGNKNFGNKLLNFITELRKYVYEN